MSAIEAILWTWASLLLLAVACAWIFGRRPEDFERAPGGRGWRGSRKERGL